MGKANLAQEKRIMLFEEVYGAWTERRLTQEAAAELLGVCPRTFRRWSERYAAGSGRRIYLKAMALSAPSRSREALLSKGAVRKASPEGPAGAA